MKKISLKKLSLEKKKKKKGSYLNLPKTSTKFFTTESTESWPQVHIQNKLRYELIFFICNIVNPLLIWVSKIYI